ncbi:MAG: hypothetical protein ACYTAO_02430 [Planctomycetota bacterium]
MRVEIVGDKGQLGVGEQVRWAGACEAMVRQAQAEGGGVVSEVVVVGDVDVGSARDGLGANSALEPGHERDDAGNRELVGDLDVRILEAGENAVANSDDAAADDGSLRIAWATARNGTDRGAWSKRNAHGIWGWRIGKKGSGI